MAAPLAGQAGAVLRDLALRSARLRAEFPAPASARTRWSCRPLRKPQSAGPVHMEEDFLPPRSCWRDSTAGNTYQEFREVSGEL